MTESSSRRQVRMALRWALPLLVAGAAADRAAADTAAMLRCRQLSDPAARLACYDAVVLPASSAPTEKRDASPVAAGAGPTAALAKPQDEFGFERRKSVPPPEMPYLESAIQGPFDGWVAKQRMRLANGQLWEITDGSQASYRLRDPKVKISRGVAGTFFMEVQGVSQTPRVRRVE